MSWVGIDIGGANLKAADGRGWARSMPFPLWRNPHGLVEALTGLLDLAPVSEKLVVTMTGELCDCFSSKAEGVRHILAAVEEIAGRREVRVYLVDGRLVSLAEAGELPHLAAASNWHALASFACRFVTAGAGLLIDVGSTTTDVIPIVGGKVAARGRNDTERLLFNELLYRGVGRTPICAIVDALPWQSTACPIAAELFATTADAYLLTGDLREDPEAEWTADGRPLTKVHARQRLARQLCADAAEFSPADFERMADAVRDTHCDEMAACVGQVISHMSGPLTTCLLSGAGEFLGKVVARRMLGECRILSLSAEIGPHASRCAPSYAVAMLASEASGAFDWSCF
jgi:probable H4MPT-linked C1 transfer pathway protein